MHEALAEDRDGKPADEDVLDDDEDEDAGDIVDIIDSLVPSSDVFMVSFGNGGGEWSVCDFAVIALCTPEVAGDN